MIDKSLIIKNINYALDNYNQVELRLDNLTVSDQKQYGCNKIRLFIKNHSYDNFWVGTNLNFSSLLIKKDYVYDAILSKVSFYKIFNSYDWSSIYDSAGLYDEEKDVLIKYAGFGV